MVARIEYAIVALRLSAKDVAEIINDATGVVVNPEDAGFLQALDMAQLEAVWERLSKDPKWHSSDVQRPAGRGKFGNRV